MCAVCIPQRDRQLQKDAIRSLCYYAQLCSRFIPLVRDEESWRQLYAEDINDGGGRRSSNESPPRRSSRTCTVVERMKPSLDARRGIRAFGQCCASYGTPAQTRVTLPAAAPVVDSRSS